MEMKGKRASDRKELEVPIEVSGADCWGRQFVDRTHAEVISRSGGKIGLERKLVSQQEVMVRCVATGREAEALIVGLLGQTKGTYYYGVKFIGEENNIWGVEFPLLAEPEGAVGEVWLECIGCKNREAIALTDFELEVLEANGNISRSCKVCRDVSLWRKSSEDAKEPAIATPRSSAPVPVAAQRQERRREPRRGMRVVACVRTTRHSQDLVKTQTVSRRGLSFTSPCEYVMDETIEVAVPYSEGGGNIFLPAKIVRLQVVPEKKWTYGVAFLKG
jgi:hypothetical protein